MSLRNLLKVGINIASVATNSMIIELDHAEKEILLKEWFLSKILLKSLHKKGLTDIKSLSIKPNGINLDHDIFGIIAIAPKNINFNHSESVIFFDVILIEDKLKNELNKAKLNAAIQGVVGGVLAYCSFGFAGGSLMVDAVKEISVAHTNYVTSEKCSFLGLNQKFSIPSPTVLDPSTRLNKFLEENGGELRVDLIIRSKQLAISARTLSMKQLEDIKQNMISLGKDLSPVGEHNSNMG